MPLTWELVLENDDAMQQATASYSNDVTDGGQLDIGNIIIPPCGRVRIQYQTMVDGMAASRVDLCDGGDVDAGASILRTISPLPDQRPDPPPSASDPNDTCMFVNDRCGLREQLAIELNQTIVDVNGPPLLPGDAIVGRAEPPVLPGAQLLR